MILREKWVARLGILEALVRNNFAWPPSPDAQRKKSRSLSIASPTAPQHEPIVAMEDVENPKPAPDGLLQIAAQNPGATLFYVGDSIDDARSARAASIPFIGIAAPSNPRYVDLRIPSSSRKMRTPHRPMTSPYLNEVFPA